MRTIDLDNCFIVQWLSLPLWKLLHDYSALLSRFISLVFFGGGGVINKQRASFVTDVVLSPSKGTQKCRVPLQSDVQLRHFFGPFSRIQARATSVGSADTTSALTT